MTEEQLQETTRMFEYLRDDMKEMREENRQRFTELNSKIDKLADALTAHDSRDQKDFKESFQRIGAMEVAQATEEKDSRTFWERSSGTIALLISAAAIVVAVIYKG